MLNILIVFGLSGLWHGANWTFVAWGGVHACYFLPRLLWRGKRQETAVVAQDRCLPTVAETFQMGMTFLAVLVAWTFFRAPSIDVALDWLNRMTVLAPGGGGEVKRLFTDTASLATPVLVCGLLGVEWLARRLPHGLARLPANPVLRWSVYYAIIALILFFAPTRAKEFIYFQF